MLVEVKVCGLTRPADARAAADLGASYVGVIFAGGPRNLSAARAREVLDGAGEAVQRVGVFGTNDPSLIAAVASEAALDIVQLHADPTVADVEAIRRTTGLRVWAVVRVAGALAPGALDELWTRADAVMLDAKAGAALGGTGTSFDWDAALQATGSRRVPLIVAGGLNDENVLIAIRKLSPDIVDVSSGVESSPGIKDHVKIERFIDAVRRTGVLR